MKLLQWDKSYEGGIAEIDDQHQHLVEMINDLHDAMIVGQGAQLLKDVFDRLIDYTRYHFQQEEALLESHGYPDLEQQRQEHARLTEQVIAFRTRQEAGMFNNAVKTDRFLKSWLIDHILDKDLQAMSYVLERNRK